MHGDSILKLMKHHFGRRDYNNIENEIVISNRILLWHAVCVDPLMTPSLS